METTAVPASGPALNVSAPPACPSSAAHAAGAAVGEPRRWCTSRYASPSGAANGADWPQPSQRPSAPEQGIATHGLAAERRPPADQLSVGLDTRRSGEPHLRCFAGGPGADRPTSGRSDRPARAARPVRSGAGPPRRPSCSRRSGRAWRSARSGPSPRPSARIPTATISDQTATSVADRARARRRRVVDDPFAAGSRCRPGRRGRRGPRPPAPIAGTASASRDAPMPREGGAVNHPRIEL